MKKARRRIASKCLPRLALDTSLPTYLKPLPSDLPETDLEYLRSKGVLSAPIPSIQEKLWETYFRVIHPFLPILDHHETLRSINSDQGATPISLILFHCVNLVARLFMDWHETYHRKGESLHSMFEKARVLYDLDLERDPVPMLQSALLMTFYPQPLNSAKGPVHWLAHAVSIAYSIGLHRDSIDRALTARQNSVRKQLWWSLYIRERTIMLDHGLPWMIDDKDYDIPMMTNEDFSLAPLIHDAESPEWDMDLEGRASQTRLGLLFLQRTKLATVLSQLGPFSIICYEWNTRSIKTQWPRLHSRTPNLEDLHDINRKLDRWWTEMRLETVCSEWFNSDTESTDSADNSYSALLQLHYAGLLLTYRIAVHHISCLRWLQTTGFQITNAQVVMKDLRAATWAIIHLVQDLLRQEARRRLDLLGPSAIRPLLIYVILSQRSPSPLLTAMEANNIHSFLVELGEGDPWFSQVYSYVGRGADTVDGLSPVSFNDSKGSVLQTEPQTRQISNIFDGILSDFNMDIDGFVSELSRLNHILQPHELATVDCFEDFAPSRSPLTASEAKETKAIDPSQLSQIHLRTSAGSIQD
ncbi:hypothetical protein N7532_000249 [Penicillium argentinense]|uniref:Xylanolytic transcriptional activator regulatory domain-containing protein n=1 Tax=Penicillium argentinense TaxID=1131581 RepID=A0A9W9G562_9EURO|nr:uncharacterized protein N7532_000249 [Penicillium argentinense]KAJ5112204.1 hypothetical protein N7532_000249 [Penicillium argentinense]